MEAESMLSPAPLSYYKDHDLFDWYFKNEDGPSKQGQCWDLFNSWGQERLLFDKKDGVSHLISSRLPMTYRAKTCTVPTLPPNTTGSCDEEDKDPCVQPLTELRELTRMKEAILYRVSMTKDSKRKYGMEVEYIRQSARNILRRLRKELRLSAHSGSSEEEEGSEQGSASPKIQQKPPKRGSRKKRKSPKYVEMYDIDSDSSTEGVPLERLEAEIDRLTGENPLLSRVLCDMHKDPRLFSDINIPVIPTEFIGGCLSSALAHTDQQFIAHSTGQNMSTLTVKQVDAGEEFTEMSVIGTANHGEQIKQVELACYRNGHMVATRGSSELCIYDVDSSGGVISRRDVIRRTDINHVSLSPYYPEALLVCSDSIYRWDEYGHFDELFSNWSTRFPVHTDIKTVHFGCHPRQVVMTDATVSSLYDTRTKSSGIDLFEVPSNTVLHVDERLVTSTQARDFTHHIMAHHTLLTIDERFAKYPLLYQMLPCLTYPMLLDNTWLDSTKDLVLVGCPTNQEVFSLVADYTHSLLKTTPIWKCSQPSDIRHFRTTQPSIPSRLMATTRLEAGIIGLAATKGSEDDGDFTVHMLSSKGDLYEQTYVSKTSLPADDEVLPDITKSAGPVLEKVDMLPCVTERCRAWYDMLSSGSSIDPRNTFPTQDIVIPKSNTFPAHQACSICNEMPVSANQVLTPEEVADNLQCLACGLLPNQSEALAAKLKSKQYCDLGMEELVDPPVLTSFNPVEKAGQDANSRLLVQLWNGEEFSETLAQRDKEWDERREKLNTQLLQGACRTLRSSELDAFSSITGGTKAPHKSAGSLSSRHEDRFIPGFGSGNLHRTGTSIASAYDLQMSDMLLPENLSLLVGESPSTLTPTFSQKKGKRGKAKGF